MLPLSAAIQPSSALHAHVKPGIQSIAEAGLIAMANRSDFSQSIDLDNALAPDHPTENRWDYLLGHSPSGL